MVVGCKDDGRVETLSHQGNVARRVLFVFAHADDETLLAGALIARLIADDYFVKVLCLAPGSEDRTHRLRKACSVLGVGAVETLRYSEGAMWPVDDAHGATVGPEPPDAIQARLSSAPVADLSGRISGRIAEFDADIVITHSPYGDYGHADHAAVSRAARRAVQEVSLSSDSNICLYELEWPRWVVRLNTFLMKLGKRDLRRMGHDGNFDFLDAMRGSAGYSRSLDVSAGLQTRRRASVWYEREIAEGPLPMRILERLPLRFQQLILGKARLNMIVGPAGFDHLSDL